MKNLKQILKNSKKKKNKIVFTNGVFDILTFAHIHLLRKAKKLGDVLIVGLNSDKSTKRLGKIPPRPINNELNRKGVLEAISYVDKVIIFDEDNPINIIKKIRPDFLVKGGDYHKKDVVGKEFVESHGGKVVIIPYLKGFSTTKLIKKIQKLNSSLQGG